VLERLRVAEKEHYKTAGKRRGENYRFPPRAYHAAVDRQNYQSGDRKMQDLKEKIGRHVFHVIAVEKLERQSLRRDARDARYKHDI